MLWSPVIQAIQTHCINIQASVSTSHWEMWENSFLTYTFVPFPPLPSIHPSFPSLCSLRYNVLWMTVTVMFEIIWIVSVSNHFYCHITTAQVPWWVKFLRACSWQCQKKLKLNYFFYIWTVHIYRLYRRQCAKYTYIYSVHTVYYKDILSYQYTLYTSTLCTHLYILICEGATDYTFTTDWLCKGATDYAYAMSWMCFVWCPVIADVLVQCVRVVR